MSDTKFIEGIYFNQPHEKAPDFVKLNLAFERDKLIAWLKDQPEKFYAQVKESKKGSWYASIDDYKKPEKTEKPEPIGNDDDLPF